MEWDANRVEATIKGDSIISPVKMNLQRNCYEYFFLELENYFLFRFINNEVRAIKSDKIETTVEIVDKIIAR